MKFIAILLAAVHVVSSSVLHERIYEIRNRIINGNEAVPHSNPWQCGLIVSQLSFPGLTSNCGGSILSENFVLTSAFCVQNSERTLVIAGAHRMFEFESTQQRFYVQSQNYIIHPDYSQELIRNDIALLKLDRPVVFNEFVQPIKLPSDRLLDSNFIGEDTQVAGNALITISFTNREINGSI
jgi:secreted trypsin-like serine protease